MYAPRPQAALRDLKAAPFAQQHIRRRHAHVFKEHFAVAVRRVVVTEDWHHSDNSHARRIHRHKNHRLLFMLRRGRVGLAHKDSDLTTRVARARCPPLAPVEDVAIAVACDARLNVRRIARSHLRLGHRKA